MPTPHPKVKIHGGFQVAGGDSPIENLELEELTTDPTTPNVGRLWINSVEQRIKCAISLDVQGNPQVSTIFDALAVPSVIAHAAKHLPNGTDPLTTAAAIGLTLSTTNTEGTANSFARSDHTHQITGVQPSSAVLTAAAAVTGTGLLTLSAGGVWAARTLVAADVPALDWSKITTGKPTTLAGYGITDAAPLSHVGAGGSAHAVVTTTVAGFMSSADKTKLDAITGTNTGDQTSVTGNAGTATKLQTARLIAGVSFDGSADIAISHTALTGIGTNTHAQIDTALTRLANTSGSNTGDQTITLTGDATGSGVGSFAVTLASTGVAAGTYNNSATAITPFTVDAKGRITATGAAVAITPAWASVTGKPTTAAGYGIIDLKPTNVVNIYSGAITAVSGTTMISLAGTAPAATVGTELFTQQITPESANSKFVVKFGGTVDSGSSGSKIITIAVFRRIGAGGSWTYIGHAHAYSSAANLPEGITGLVYDAPATTQDVYYMGRIGISVSGKSWYFGTIANNDMGGPYNHAYEITELRP